MKLALQRALALILVLSAMVSCSEEKKATYTIESPDKTIRISMVGHKENFAEPFITTIGIKTPTEETAVETELFASTLSAETVHYQWTSPTTCKIQVKEQDNKERRFVIDASEGVSLNEEQ